MIHSAVHEARPEVGCVIHTHSWASMAVSALDCGLLPITQTAMRFLKIGYHDYQGVVLDDEGEGIAACADLGDGEAVILRNHGALVVGRTRRRGLQLDAPAGARLPLADRRHVVQHAAAAGAAARCWRRPGTTTSPAPAGRTA